MKYKDTLNTEIVNLKNKNIKLIFLFLTAEIKFFYLCPCFESLSFKKKYTRYELLQ